MIHLRHTHPVYGAVPLCGQAMWESLTMDPVINECWECASINGTSHISHAHMLIDEEAK